MFQLPSQNIWTLLSENTQTHWQTHSVQANHTSSRYSDKANRVRSHHQRIRPGRHLTANLSPQQNSMFPWSNPWRNIVRDQKRLGLLRGGKRVIPAIFTIFKKNAVHEADSKHWIFSNRRRFVFKLANIFLTLTGNLQLLALSRNVNFVLQWRCSVFLQHAVCFCSSQFWEPPVFLCMNSLKTVKEGSINHMSISMNSVSALFAKNSTKSSVIFDPG